MARFEIRGPLRATRSAFLPLLVVFLFLHPARAQFAYEVQFNQVVITSYNSPDLEVIIPAAVEGKPVTQIGPRAFLNQPITSLSLPPTVTFIHEMAFAFCDRLATVTLSPFLTDIDREAFIGCRSLAAIELPASLTYIGDFAFTQCSALLAISVDPLNQSYSNADGVLFNKNQTRLIQYPTALPGAYSLPATVIAIAAHAFEGARVTSVSIPQAVTTIESAAFAGSGLTSVAIPPSVTMIGSQCFANCSDLASISVDASNPSYSSSDGVLFNKEKNWLYTYPPAHPAALYTVPDSVTAVDNQSFERARNLIEVNLPDSVGILPYRAFAECSNLSRIRVGQNLFAISSEAFLNCRSLESISIPNGVTVIPFRAFFGCENLASISVPPALREIGFEAFAGCGNLAAFAFPPTVRWLAGGAFYGCSSLTEITLPNGLFDIGERAFMYCEQLRIANIPDGIETIRHEAFKFCGNLKTVTVGRDVTTIGYHAFWGCDEELTVSFLGDAPSVGQSAMDNARIYYLPGRAGWTGIQNALLWNPQPQAVQFTPGQNNLNFTITGSPGIVVIVESTPALQDALWSPVQSLTLENGAAYFQDPNSSAIGQKIYRLRTP